MKTTTTTDHESFAAAEAAAYQMENTFKPDSAAAAVHRHLLSKGVAGDRQILADFMSKHGSQVHEFPQSIMTAEVKQLAGVKPHMALSAIYGGRIPTFNLAVAMALDEMDGTPGKWVGGVYEEYRWDPDFDFDDLFDNDEEEVAE